MRKKRLDPKIVREKIEALWTDRAIGEFFGISRQAIYQYRKLNGITCVKGRHSMRNQDIVKMSKKISGTKIAEQLGLSISQTYRILKASNVNSPKQMPLAGI